MARILGQFGSFGSGPGQFNLPWGICLDAEGSVYVADWRNDRIQKLTQDGECLATFGSSGSGVGQFNRPSGVAVDADGDYLCRRPAEQPRANPGAKRALYDGPVWRSPVVEVGQREACSNPDMIRQRALAVAHDPGLSKSRFLSPVPSRWTIKDALSCSTIHAGDEVYTKSRDPVLV